MRRTAALLALVGLLAGGSPATAGRRSATPAERGASWLLKLVGPDGALRALDGQPDYSGTITVGLALAAARTGGGAFRRTARFVADHVDDYAVRNGLDRPGALGRIAMLLVLDGRDVRPLVDRILARRQLAGPYAGQLSDPENPGNFAHALGLLGVAAAPSLTGEQRAAAGEAVDYLLAQQCDSGGWPLGARVVVLGDAPVACGSGTSGPDTNTTALAVEALKAFGATPRTDPLPWLREVQNADGGFGYFSGSPTETDSTALVVQALVALGADPGRFGTTPAYSALLGLQIGCGAPDAGAWVYQRSATGAARANGFATGEAVPAAARLTFPLRRTGFRYPGAAPACPA